MKRVLVTGASGFVGRQCLAPMQRKGFEVHAIARRPLEATPGICWHQADLLDDKSIGTTIQAIKPTHLLHLAWIATPGVFWTSSLNLRWLEGSVRLLHAFASHGGSRIVIAGTCAEFDWSNLRGPCGNQTACRPASLYGTCKNVLRLVLHAYAQQMGLSAACGRLFLMYGPHEHPDRLVPSVITRLLHRQPVACTHGFQQRDFMHVGDAANALVALLDSEVQGDVSIGTGVAVTVRDVVSRLAESLDGIELVKWGSLSLPPQEPTCLVADHSRLANEVGFTPQWSLTAGLEDAIAWWREKDEQDEETRERTVSDSHAA